MKALPFAEGQCVALALRGEPNIRRVIPSHQCVESSRLLQVQLLGVAYEQQIWFHALMWVTHFVVGD